jgi:hypothetical protein
MNSMVPWVGALPFSPFPPIYACVPSGKNTSVVTVQYLSASRVRIYLLVYHTPKIDWLTLWAIVLVLLRFTYLGRYSIYYEFHGSGKNTSVVTVQYLSASRVRIYLLVYHYRRHLYSKLDWLTLWAIVLVLLRFTYLGRYSIYYEFHGSVDLCMCAIWQKYLGCYSTVFVCISSSHISSSLSL